MTANTSKPAKPNVPKAMLEHYAAVTELTDAFSAEHLDGEYAEVARRMVAALCRKRPSPLVSGKQQVWACAILYAVGQVNFLSDKASSPNMSMGEFCRLFGVGASTAAKKAKDIRDLLDIGILDPAWTLPSRIAANPVAWMVNVNGFLMDARRLPIELQEQAVAKGLIPYVVEPETSGGRT